MVKRYRLLFTGPQELYQCSKNNMMYLFQYARHFQCKRVMEWTGGDATPLLLQVFMTLKLAADENVLPTPLSTRHLVIGDEAAMIDIVTYLSSKFTTVTESSFGNHCPEIVPICQQLVEKHLPESHQCHKWLSTLDRGTQTKDVLDRLIAILCDGTAVPRVEPRFVDNKCFTFRECLSDMANWTRISQGDQVSQFTKPSASAKVIVCGEPSALDVTNSDILPLDRLVKNIIFRLKAKVFGSDIVTVAALDCTKGLTKISLHTGALEDTPTLKKLDRNHFTNGTVYLHDPLVTRPKWTSVIRIFKGLRYSPIPECTVTRYRVTILMVSVGQHGHVRSLDDLFSGVSMVDTTEY